MSENIEQVGMGWLPDYPDFRDFSMESTEVSPRLKAAGVKANVKEMVQSLGVGDPDALSLPATQDLRQWCSPIENQGSLGSCTANAGVGLVEYFERRAFGKHIDASRLFLYKATRNLLRWTGDTGAFLRTTMGAMVLFGTPPEGYWPYVIADFDKEPSAFCYAFGQNYQTIQYFRLDPPNTPKETLMKRIKGLLRAGLPSMFGFTVFTSIGQAGNDGKIPFPCYNEKIAGGHAIVAVGYDDKMKIKNTLCNKTTTGAFLIRNSWGLGWGDDGYGWFPYDYVLKGLAIDWWSLLRQEWVDTGNFKM
jgi:C1A family cysteine protease